MIFKDWSMWEYIIVGAFAGVLGGVLAYCTMAA
jgi:hypothetical protein